MTNEHKLELQQAGSGDHFNGRCTCGGWYAHPGRWHDSKKEVKRLFNLHKKVAGVFVDPPSPIPMIAAEDDIGNKLEVAEDHLRHIARRLRNVVKNWPTQTGYLAGRAYVEQSAQEILDVINKLEN